MPLAKVLNQLRYYPQISREKNGAFTLRFEALTRPAAGLTYCKAATLMVWHKEGPTDQWKLPESLKQILDGNQNPQWEITALGEVDFTAHGHSKQHGIGEIQ